MNNPDKLVDAQGKPLTGQMLAFTQYLNARDAELKQERQQEPEHVRDAAELRQLVPQMYDDKDAAFRVHILHGKQMDRRHAERRARQIESVRNADKESLERTVAAWTLCGLKGKEEDDKRKKIEAAEALMCLSRSEPGEETTRAVQRDAVVEEDNGKNINPQTPNGLEYAAVDETTIPPARRTARRGAGCHPRNDAEHSMPNLESEKGGNVNSATLPAPRKPAAPWRRPAPSTAKANASNVLPQPSPPAAEESSPPRQQGSSRSTPRRPTARAPVGPTASTTIGSRPSTSQFPPADPSPAIPVPDRPDYNRQIEKTSSWLSWLSNSFGPVPIEDQQSVNELRVLSQTLGTCVHARRVLADSLKQPDMDAGERAVVTRRMKARDNEAKRLRRREQQLMGDIKGQAEERQGEEMEGVVEEEGEEMVSCGETQEGPLESGV